MLEQLWKKIVRRRPLSLWVLPAFLLWLMSFGYRLGFLLARLMSGSPTKVSVPVVSVGNITVGGSGKTPMVGVLTEGLIDKGVRVGIVSSGYGRESKESFVAPGYKVQQMEVGVTGDEVMLLAHCLPDAVFSVDPVKTIAAQNLADSDLVDVIVVDDGFQHRRLARDIDLVTWDAGHKERWLKPFPYGLLRESKKAMARADIIVITRAKFALDINAIKRSLRRLNGSAQIYQAAFEANDIVGHDRQWPAKYLEDKSVYLFAGVGNFQALKRQVTALAADLDHALELSDHQRYDPVLLDKIKSDADRFDSDLVLTTFKDWVKLADFDFGREFYYLDLAVDLDPGEERLVAEIMQRLNLKDKTT
jgi:tetraacyldisaccharide 4'-kinase